MEHVVEHGSARLAVTDTGGGGRPLLALHAGVADSRIWSGVTPTWAEAGWRVVAYDRRGYGRTTWTPEPHDPVDDLVAVMDDRGLESAVVVGNSIGGSLALRAALDVPDRVDALVVVAGTASGQPWEHLTFTAEEEALEAAVEEAEAAGDAERAARLEAHLWLDGPGQPEGRVGGPARDLFIDMSLIARRADPVGEQVQGEPTWPRLAQLGVPCLVVVGELDECPQMFLELAEAIPGAQVVRHPGWAHLPMLEDPDGFAAVVGPFLEGLDR